MNDQEIYSEASFPTGSIGNVIKNYVSLLQKRLGTKIHGPKVPFILNLTKGMSGLKFLIKGGRGFRINWKGNSIDSASVWLKPGWKPDYTVDLKGLNAVQVADAMTTALKGKREEVAEENIIEKTFEDMYIEARGGGAPAFSEYTQTDEFKKAFPHGKVSIGSFNTLYKTWAKKNSKPPATYTQARQYVLGMNSGDGGTAIARGAIARGSRGIDISNEGPSKEAKDLLASIGLAPGERQSGDSIFRQIEQFTLNVVQGRKNALIVAGDPGLGKCHSGNTMITIKK